MNSKSGSFRSTLFAGGNNLVAVAEEDAAHGNSGTPSCNSSNSAASLFKSMSLLPKKLSECRSMRPKRTSCCLLAR